MIQDGDYIREQSTGQLYKVFFSAHDGYHSFRFSDHKTAVVKHADALKVKEPSMLPGEPEKTEGNT